MRSLWVAHAIGVTVAFTTGTLLSFVTAACSASWIGAAAALPSRSLSGCLLRMPICGLICRGLARAGRLGDLPNGRRELRDTREAEARADDARSNVVMGPVAPTD